MSLNTDPSNLARSMIRAAMLNCRSTTPPIHHDSSKAMVTQIRTDLLDGSLAQRLIIHLHSSGCGWAQKSGGCTMCGFFAATSTGIPITSDHFLTQVTEELSKHSPQAFSILGLYNAGNILNDAEMPFEALERICANISTNPHIKRVSIESKLEYMDTAKLKRMISILKGKEIELGIGVETMNEKIRDLCINKPFPNSLLEHKVENLLSLGIIPKAYLLFKPPFLTEKESIDDLLNSFTRLKKMGVERINCETMTIEEHTLVYELWQRNYYRTPWLWSIIHILKQLNGTRLYFTPFEYIVSALSTAHNCDRCSDRIKNRIFDYQEGNLSFQDLLQENCTCKEDWINELQRIDDRPIEKRIIDTLSAIAMPV